MRLFVAEKPSLAQTVAAGLGGGKRGDGCIECGNDIVTWCFGHMYELAGPEHYKDEWKNWDMATLPMIPDKWQKLPRKDAKKQIAIIKKLLKSKSCNEVVNAGDPDREGQLLVDEILEELGWQGKTSRIWLDALDDASVQKALNNIRPNSDFKGLCDSAEARGFADWTVGLNLTRAYTCMGRKAGYKGVLTIGRVQTPTLALVAKRDAEIENFRPVPFFVVNAQFAVDRGFYRGKWQPGEDDLDASGYLTDKAKVDAVCSAVKGKAATVEAVTSKKNQQTPELPFSLSALQAYANKKWGYGAKQTLDLAQSLYETHKATTYPRTDCRFLSEGQHAEVKKTMLSISAADPVMVNFIKQCDLDKKPKMFNDKKITAHTAIVPTMEPPNVKNLLKNLNSEELNIYDAIRRRYIAQFLPLHEFESSTILTKCEGSTFKTTGKKVLVQGWKFVEAGAISEGETEGQDQEEESSLPDLKEKTAVTCEGVEQEAKQTKPPERFTEGSLITAMAGISKFVEDPEIKKRLKETAGIGTEATRGQILENLKSRDLLTTKGKTIIASQAGRELIAVLPDALTSAATTAMWEMGLEGISTGKVTLNEFLTRQNAWVTKEIESAGKVDLKALASLPPAGGKKKATGKKKGFFKKGKK